MVQDAPSNLRDHDAFSLAMPRSPVFRLLLVLGALTLPAAPAYAQGSLLSGYGGPGGGEQVILGSQLLGGGSGGGGGGTGSGAATAGGGGARPGLRATAPAPAPAAAPVDSSGPAATPARPSTGARRPSGSGSSRERSGAAPARRGRGTTAAEGTAPPAPAATPAPVLGAPERVAYPQVNSASSLPLSRRDLLLVLASGLILLLVVLVTRTLTRWQPGDPGTA